MLEIGKKAKDKVTGFEGIIIGRIEYLTGCDQYGLVPEYKGSGELPKSEWFDVGRLEIIGDGITATQVQSAKPGGPNRDAPRV
jgi:hypothetical protein